MHNGENENAVRLYAVQNAVGKTVYQAAMNFIVEFRPPGRIADGILNRRINFPREVKSQAGVAAFVVGNGRTEFFFRLGMEGTRYLANCWRIFANTASPGTGLT